MLLVLEQNSTSNIEASTQGCEALISIDTNGSLTKVKNDNSRLLSDLDTSADFYFVHSYKVSSESNIVKSICNYGSNFIASFESDNIAGVQFHPELSQSNGMKVISNFIEYF